MFTIVAILASVFLGYNVYTGFKFAKGWEDEPDVYKPAIALVGYVSALFVIITAIALYSVAHLIINFLK